MRAAAARDERFVDDDHSGRSDSGCGTLRRFGFVTSFAFAFSSVVASLLDTFFFGFDMLGDSGLS